MFQKHQQNPDLNAHALTLMTTTLSNLQIRQISVDNSFDTNSSSQILKTKPEAATNGIITISPLVGRLGNHLFQLASAYGVAQHNGRMLITSGHFEVSDYFDVQIAKFSEEEQKALQFTWVREAQVCAFDENLFNLVGLSQNTTICLAAYMQSWVYFAHVFDETRRMFTFRTEIIKQVNSFFANITSSPTPTEKSDIRNFNSTNCKVSQSRNNDSDLIQMPTFIGIHVRRGDMTTEANRNFGFGTGEADYIERAMLHYLKPRRFHYVTFVECSDSVYWCQKNIRKPKDVSSKLYRIVFCGKRNSPILDLGILSSCNHSIITGGTFGWWSAFLAGGETVYYTGYPRKGTILERAFSPNRTDFWLPGWVGMD